MPKNLPPPPIRLVRPDRRVSFILPPAYVPWVTEDLAAGWTLTGIVVAALSLAYPNAEAAPKPSVALRNGPKAPRRT